MIGLGKNAVAVEFVSKKKVGLHSSLLISAAASAILFMGAAPAEAGCVLASGTYTCSGALTSADFTSINLPATIVLDGTAHINNSAVLVNGTASNGAFSLTADAGSQQDAGGSFGVNGAYQNGGTSANTAFVDNSGAFQTYSIGELGDAFAGLVTVDNETVGSINNLTIFGAAGEDVTNKGLIGSVDTYIVATDAVTVEAVPHANDGTDTTDISGSTRTDTAGLATINNNVGASVTDGMVIYANGITATNAGSIAGDLDLNGSNGEATGDTSTTTTTVFLDPTNSNAPQHSFPGATPDYEQITEVTTEQAFGGDTSLTNSGTASGEVNEYAAGKASLSNTGAIDGDITLDTTEDNFGNDIGKSTDTTVTTETNNGTVQDTSTNETYSFAPTGGDITITNSTSALMSSSLDAYAAGNATLTNDGAVNGGVDLEASDASEAYTRNRDNSVSYNTQPPTATVVVSGPNTTTTTGNWTINSRAGSGSGSDVYTSTGGLGTLTNDANSTIGTSALSPVDVYVYGDAGSNVTNAGEIYGNVTADSSPDVESSSYAYSYSRTGGKLGFNGQTTDVEVETNDGTHPLYESSDSNITISSFGHSHSDSHSSSDVYSAATSNLTNSGDITGEAEADSSGTSLIDNSGTIEGNVEVENDYSNDSESESSANSYNGTKTTDHEYTASYSGADFLTNYGTGTTYDGVSTFSSSESSSSSSIGATATLTNEATGTIGLETATVDVDVDGQSAGTLTNDGIIYGDTSVEASTGNFSEGESASGSKETKATHDTGISYTNGIETEATSQDSVEHIDSISSSSAETFAYTGGDALLTNSDGALISGDANVTAPTTATLDNLGEVDGDVNVFAAGPGIPVNETESFSFAASSDDLSTDKNDETFATASGTTTTVTTDSTNLNNSETSSTLVSISESTTGGVATLTNEASGVIGTSLSPVEVTVEGDTATASNAGSIDGDVLVESVGSSGSEQVSGSDTETEVGSTTTNITHIDNGVTPYDSSNKTTSSFTTTDSGSESESVLSSGSTGDASLTNDGTIDHTGASGTVQVISVDTETAELGSETFSSSASSTDNYDYEGSLTGTTVSATITDAKTSEVSSSASGSSISADVAIGGTASLTNDTGATIGSAADYDKGKGYFDDVTVSGLTSSTAVNNGTIYGNVTVGNELLANVILIESEGGSSDLKTTENDIETTVTPGTPTVTSFDNKTTAVGAGSETEGEAFSFTSEGGPASYTGSGTVVGSVDVYSVGNATATVTGHIGDPVNGYGNFTVESGGYAASIGGSDTEAFTENNASEDQSPDGKAETLTVNNDDTSANTTVASGSLTSLGGTATLVNKGVIGGDAEKPMEVYVIGAAGATLLNNAHISGDVDVESEAADGAFAFKNANTTSDVLSSVKTWADLTKTTAFVLNSTETLTNEDAFTLTYDLKQVGGVASATNTSSLTITGNLTVSGFAGAPVVNSGSIWGNVTAESEGTNYAGNITSDDKTTTVTTITPTTTVVNTTVADSGESKTSSMYAGGDATLSNSGKIGLLTNDGSGGIDITGGNVNMSANGNVSADNTITGVIYGNVDGNATGATETDDTITSDQSNSVATTTTKTGTTVTVYSDQTSSTDTYAYTYTGGTATLQNDGKIGQRFADSSSECCDVTEPGGVYLYGDAGASITNTNLIGGDAEATSSLENYTYTSANTTATNSTITNPGADTDTYTYSSTNAVTTTYTADGGTATIVNTATGSIGATVLNGDSEANAIDANVTANGDAGASVTNAGKITAQYINAESNNYNEVETYNDTYTENEAGSSLYFANSTEVSSTSNVSTPTGGMATVTNTGSMLAGEGGLTVTANGYGGASVTNAAKALIQGDVNADSYGYATSNTDSYTQNDLGFAGADTLSERIETTTSSDIYSGGDASIDNSGNITGYVTADAFGNASVTNEASGKIGESVEAESYFFNYNLTATVDTVGPAFPDATPTEADTFTDVYTAVGGNATIDNFGAIGGDAEAYAFQAATITNEVGATIGGAVYENTLFEGFADGGDDAGIETNTNGVVTEQSTGGVSTFTNLGVVSGGFDIDSFGGSTLTNAAGASIGVYVDDSYGSYLGTYSAAAHNTFNNAGVIGFVGDYGYGSIEFQGNTVATNTGIITEDLVFTQSDDLSAPSVATFNFGQGSVLEGDINNPGDVSDSYGGVNGLAQLTVNFENSGAYPGNIYGATATNKTGMGTWFLTGDTYQLGTTTISGGTLQFGLPSSESAADLLDDDTWNVVYDYFGTNPLLGNTAIATGGLNSVVGGLSSSLIASPVGATVVTGDISVGTAGALEAGNTIFLGNITNAGTYVAGYVLPGNLDEALGNLLGDSNFIDPSKNEISGNFTQTSTGTTATNFAPTVDRDRYVEGGTEGGLFAPTSFWLGVTPFVADGGPSTMTVVDGSATVGGTVKVYVDKNGLYVNGDSRTILSSTGPLAVTATTTQSAPSLFVGFGLTETKSGATNLLNVVVDRTSYASVATNSGAAAVGHALDSAVPAVAAAITANNFPSLAAFTDAQDLAGFLTDLDWQVGSASTANAILTDLSPSGWASLGEIDTGLGFRSQIMRHLTEERGFSDDPAFGAWSQSYGLSQDVNKSGGAAGLDSNTYGTSLGWDTQIDNYVVGIAGGYGRTSLGGGSSNFSGHITSYQIGGYGSASWGRWFADLNLWGNFGNGSMTRRIPTISRVGTASVSTDEFRADGEVGYRFETDEGMGISPYGSLNYRDAHYGNITEKGLGGLGYTLTGVGGSFFSPDLGVTLDDKWQVSDALMIKPMIGAAVEFQSSPDTVSAEFLGGGNPFAVKSAAKNGVAFKPEAGVNMPLGTSASLQIGYQGTYGGNVSSSGLWAGLRFTW